MYSKDVLELLGDHGGRLVLLEEHLLVQARVQTGAVDVHPVLPLDVGVEGGHIDGGEDREGPDVLEEPEQVRSGTWPCSS